MYPQVIVNFHLSEKHTVVFGGYCQLSDGRSWSVFLAINLSEKCFSFLFLVMRKHITIFYKTWQRSSFGKRNLSPFPKNKSHFFSNGGSIIIQWQQFEKKKEYKKEHRAPLCIGDLHVFIWKIVSFFNGLYRQNSKKYQWRLGSSSQ